MWNFNKLFTKGNIVGVGYFNNVINEIVSSENEWGSNHKTDWAVFWNNNLQSGEAKIQYIIRLDDNGNIVEKLFDREKDMVTPRPELKTGMFVKTVYYNEHNKQFEFNSAYGDGLLGVIIDKNIIYSNGQHDYINNATQQYIAEIYKEECFNLCNYPVWRHPEYQKYLELKTNLEDKEK